MERHLVVGYTKNEIWQIVDQDIWFSSNLFSELSKKIIWLGVYSNNFSDMIDLLDFSYYHNRFLCLFYSKYESCEEKAAFYGSTRKCQPWWLGVNNEHSHQRMQTQWVRASTCAGS